MLFQSLETPRLLLRNIATEDAGFMFRQFSDPVVCKYLFDEEPFTEIRQAMDLIGYFCQPEPRNQHRWIVVRKADGVSMGTCGFHHWDRERNTAETGYDLREEFWGNGYMAEAMQAIIKFASEQMNLKKINAVIYPGNPASISLAEKLGFRLSGETFEVFRGERIPHHLYALEVGN
jgi:[ribosomal protein S5]-alanine N-acetyltransferase